MSDSPESKRLRKVTAALLVAALLVLGAWDYVVFNNDVRGDTISELLRDLSYGWWTIPLAFGVVMGHFFWNNPRSEVASPRGLILVVGLTLSRDLVNLIATLPVIPFANLAAFVVGVVCGAAWWPQLAPREDPGDETDSSDTIED